MQFTHAVFLFPQNVILSVIRVKGKQLEYCISVNGFQPFLLSQGLDPVGIRTSIKAIELNANLVINTANLLCSISHQ